MSVRHKLDGQIWIKNLTHSIPQNNNMQQLATIKSVHDVSLVPHILGNMSFKHMVVKTLVSGT